MFRLILKRLAGAIPNIIGVVIVTFLLTRALPGDPAAYFAGPSATKEAIDQVRVSLGLDKSLPVQFALYLKDLARGDLGNSLSTGQSVLTEIRQRLPASLELTLCGLLFAVVVAVPLGVLAAWKQGGWLDRALMGFSVMGFSIPVFVLGYLLIWLVSLKLGWLPVQGYERISGGFGPFIRHLILPSITLSVIYIALIARVTRASVQEVLSEDYIRTARAKGLPEARVLIGHALANAAVPIITVIGIGIALLIGGVVVTESVYGIPGLGRLTVDAVLARDFPTIQGVILFFSFVYVLINLMVDMSYLFFDPRIRY